MSFWQLHPNVKLRIVMNFILNALTNMFTPFMAVYFAKTLGTTVAGVAAILSVVVGLLSGVISGHYADRIGRKKLMIVGETTAGVALLVMALVNSPWMESAPLTLIMVLLMSAGTGLMRPAFDAMLIDVSTPESRPVMYRIMYWSNNLSFSIAGMLGAYFFSHYLFELFLFVAVVTLIAVAVTQLFILETLPKALETENAAGKRTGRSLKSTSLLLSYGKVFKDKTFLMFVIGMCLVNSVEKNLYEYMGIRLEAQMHGAAWLPWLDARVDGLAMQGYLRTENTLLVVVLSLFIGKLFRRSDGRMMLFAIFLNVIGYAYLAYGNLPAVLLLFMLIATIGELLYVPIMQSLEADIIPEDSRSAYLAIGGMGYQLGIIIAGLNVILGGFIPSGGMALMIFLTGIAAIFILMSVIQRVAGQKAPVQTTAGQSTT
ncbi:MFS transporter [Cohnella lubricantis]|uniref:MFS transporter n=1 Tax=Cohnella lubricantis TaxID=2163172 RepID=A0A841T9T0_9BACL|nr:MFS transporter [Cohnella lubricantis]MBB6678064.1 MFS transporter [Cohnella lubricantis]MBP2120042.1 DHA1 family multidrug resistance protein B-like MFS transporter [Cohnella lubricantis]